MAGKRPAGFWSGDRAEDLGVFLLRRLSCAVTEVRRQEDVGVDAVATLLRPGGTHTLLAKGSFFVQLKSASAPHIDYEGEDLDWLFEQRLPFFFGWVDQSTLSLALFAFDPVAVNCIPRRRFLLHNKLRLLPRRGDRLPSDAGVEAYQPCAERPDGGLDVFLGEPVLVLAATETTDSARLGRLRDALDEWITLAQHMVELRHYGVFLEAKWTTNATPRPSWPTFFVEKNPTPHAAGNMSRAFPVFEAIAGQVRATGSEVEKGSAAAIEAFMRRMGAKAPWE